MKDVLVNPQIFKFKYLPDFAEYILKDHLTEFTTVGIRFCREVDLPMLKPLSKLSEEQLVALSLDSNKQILTALAKNDIASYIEQNTKNWIENKLGVIDKEDILAEDLTLAFFLRRKTFSYFVYGYTKNYELQKWIISEVDVYTTQEELISYNIFMQMQQEKMKYQNELLLEAQELAEIGSFLINYKDRSKSHYTPQYKKILEMTDKEDSSDFVKAIHPQDRDAVMGTINNALKKGGQIEVEYTYVKNGKTKRIWSRAIIEVENGNPVLIKGTLRDITKKYELIQRLQQNQAR